ncbi:hydroxyacid-oxoacid transhydrogenase [Salmonella enterica]|nr:hydroxyacid-oxoacid transhydrogenase [Salmonella enterica subsp. enterica serovar Montevideo]EIX0111429.1 hydroxyacid-oxoacid transhydrogenase [Salmonella enterica]EIX2337232.1 hydroxyacid-oxoacid transhydrogenase [Salmonella enterica]EIX2346322.1 hydroxyacid-oxoacid transhydrogenase [Salmonella enterica]EMA5187556.1 hydroxyacid-oxoacid transhydrogenase [Salmonella enterica]
MSGFGAVAKLNEKKEREAVALVALYVAWKERFDVPVAAERVAGEQPEHLREYFMARLRHYRQLSTQLPDKNATEYARNEDDVKK